MGSLEAFFSCYCSQQRIPLPLPLPPPLPLPLTPPVRRIKREKERENWVQGLGFFLPSMTMEGEEEGEWLINLPGYRFHPTDEELIQVFLKPWVESSKIICPLIKVFDIYSTEPRKLAGGAHSEYLRDGQLYFLSPRYRVSKGGEGTKVRRDVGEGSWHEESLALVKDGSTVVGRKSMFTYNSFASGEGAKGKKRKASGIKTDWIMDEFVLHSLNGNGKGKQFQDKALCRIHLKNSKSNPLLATVTREEGFKRSHLSIMQQLPLLLWCHRRRHLRFAAPLEGMTVPPQRRCSARSLIGEALMLLIICTCVHRSMMDLQDQALPHYHNISDSMIWGSTTCSWT